MCTASWRWEDEKPELWFNRDEQRNRPAALPPQTDANGATYPIDPQGGGTWIFVNRHGLVGALLNGYTPAPLGPLRSRGLLLRKLSGCAGVSDFASGLDQELHQHRYASCYLIALQDRAALWHWDGDALHLLPVDLPMLTTSSFDRDSVCAARRSRFLSLVKEPKHPLRVELERFHSWKDPVFPHRSVLMSRLDARTVSRATTKEGGKGLVLEVQALEEI